MGSSTRNSFCNGRIPKASAASSNDGSISVIPTYVFWNIGNRAYTTKAMMAGTLPIPTNGISNPNKAKDGIVCKTPVICNKISAILRCRVAQIAKGIAITIASTNATSEIPKCWSRACHRSLFCSAKVWTKSFMRSTSLFVFELNYRTKKLATLTKCPLSCQLVLEISFNLCWLSLDNHFTLVNGVKQFFTFV